METTGKIEENSSSSADKSAVSPKETLTPEKIRTFSGFENLTAPEADEIILALHQLSAIIYDFITMPESSGNNLMNINQQKTAA